MPDGGGSKTPLIGLFCHANDDEEQEEEEEAEEETDVTVRLLHKRGSSRREEEEVEKAEEIEIEMEIDGVGLLTELDILTVLFIQYKDDYIKMKEVLTDSKTIYLYQTQFCGRF